MCHRQNDVETCELDKQEHNRSIQIYAVIINGVLHLFDCSSMCLGQHCNTSPTSSGALWMAIARIVACEGGVPERGGREGYKGCTINGIGVSY